MAMMPDTMISGPNGLAALGTVLSQRDEAALQGDFAVCVVSALEAVKGTLLFQMRIDAERAGRKVAAISVGQGEDRAFALVILPDGGGRVRVERAEDSDDPLATIAPSYADLINVLDVAA